MILDIDDWEVGLQQARHESWRGAFRDAVGLLDPRTVNTYWGVRGLELAVAAVPRRTVSNCFLQERFGGTLLYHLRELETLEPARADEVRRELQLCGRRWVGFVGTIRPHKGVEVLLSAVARLSTAGLLLAGVVETDKYATRVAERARSLLGPDRVRILGSFPLSRTADLVRACDVIAIPSSREAASRGQVPIKLFDAMASARPIVATDVGDHAAILEGCGTIVPPDDEVSLARGLDELLRNEARCHDLGAAARARLVKDFTAQAARAALTSLVEQCLNR